MQSRPAIPLSPAFSLSIPLTCPVPDTLFAHPAVPPLPIPDRTRPSYLVMSRVSDPSRFSIHRTSSTSSSHLSTSTHPGTFGAPPRTPSPTHDTHVISISYHDLSTPLEVGVESPLVNLQSSETTRSVKKIRSNERTRTWAEEVARQRRKAGRRAERKREERETESRSTGSNHGISVRPLDWRLSLADHTQRVYQQESLTVSSRS